MTSSSRILAEIEELRRQLHQGLGAQYDPVRIQSLAPISQELDRLTVQLTREELGSHRHIAHQ